MEYDTLISTLPKPLERGLYYIYLLPDGSITSLVMVRRPTATGIAITMVVTDEAHRGKGYGSAITSYVIQDAFGSVVKGGRGKEHVCIIWEAEGNAARIYKRLGFVQGQERVDWKLGPPSPASSEAANPR